MAPSTKSQQLRDLIRLWDRSPLETRKRAVREVSDIVFGPGNTFNKASYRIVSTILSGNQRTRNLILLSNWDKHVPQPLKNNQEWWYISFPDFTLFGKNESPCMAIQQKVAA